MSGSSHAAHGMNCLPSRALYIDDPGLYQNASFEQRVALRVSGRQSEICPHARLLISACFCGEGHQHSP